MVSLFPSCTFSLTPRAHARAFSSKQLEEIRLRLIAVFGGPLECVVNQTKLKLRTLNSLGKQATGTVDRITKDFNMNITVLNGVVTIKPNKNASNESVTAPNATVAAKGSHGGSHGGSGGGSGRAPAMISLMEVVATSRRALLRGDNSPVADVDRSDGQMVDISVELVGLSITTFGNKERDAFKDSLSRAIRNTKLTAAGKRAPLPVVKVTKITPLYGDTILVQVRLWMRFANV